MVIKTDMCSFSEYRVREFLRLREETRGGREKGCLI